MKWKRTFRPSNCRIPRLPINANLPNLIWIKAVQYANNDSPYKLAVGQLTDIHVYSCCGLRFLPVKWHNCFPNPTMKGIDVFLVYRSNSLVSPKHFFVYEPNSRQYFDLCSGILSFQHKIPLESIRSLTFPRSNYAFPVVLIINGNDTVTIYKLSFKIHGVSIPLIAGSSLDHRNVDMALTRY